MYPTVRIAYSILCLVALFGCEQRRSVPVTQAPTAQPLAAQTGPTEARADNSAAVAQGLEFARRAYDAQALAAFDQAVQQDPSDAFALAMRGVSRAREAYYVFQGEADPAGQYPRAHGDPYSRALTQCFAPTGLGDPLVVGDRPGAQAELTRIGGGSYDFPAPHSVDAAQLARMRAEFKLALSDVMRAVALDPTKVDERLLVCRGLVFLLRSDVEGPANLLKAQADLDEALLLNSRSPDALYYRSWIHFRQCSPEPGAKLYFSDKKISDGDERKPEVRELLQAPDHQQMLEQHELAAKCFQAIRDLPEAEQTCTIVRGSFERAPLGSYLMITQSNRQFFLRMTARLKQEPPANLRRLAEKYSASVVYLETNDSLGTGFFPGGMPDTAIGNGPGLIVTNAHVVADVPGGSVEVTLHDGTTTIGKVMGSDPIRDLALVKIPHRIPYQSLSGNDYSGADGRQLGWQLTEWLEADLPKVGTPLFAIGHPNGLKWTVTSGVMSASRIKDGVQLGQTDTPLNPGNSGGPVFDLDGNLVGVVVGGFKEYEGLGLFISAKDLGAFFKDQWPR